MRISDSFVSELDAEVAATRRVLERVPEAHLSWQPHAKSSSLGQLALHVASLMQQVARFVDNDALDITTLSTRQPAPASHAEVMATFDASVKTTRASLLALDDERARATWRLVARETELFAAPRAAVIRQFLFNHLYHHRGQLLVYLRLLDVPVPSVYGPTADENPFAAVLLGSDPGRQIAHSASV
jgi:uncharacterized damage-inducible protein DinB